MNNHENTELDLVGCPECGAPAEVVDHFVLHSTNGPVEHVKVQCVSRHWFTLPLGSLSPAGAPVGKEPDRWTSQRP